MSATATPKAEERVDLALEGMTCAACAGRIERKLNKLDGVDASVNYATEQAAVRFDSSRVAVADLIGAVEGAGYHARLAAEAGDGDDRSRSLRSAPDRRRGPDSASRRAVDDPAAAIRRLGVARARACHTGRVLGRLRLPSSCTHERAVPRRDDGHAHLHRHSCGVGLVGRGACRRGRRGHVLRGGGGDHDADLARPLLRGSREAALGRRDPRTPRDRRQGSPSSAGRHGGLGPDRRGRRRRSHGR